MIRIFATAAGVTSAGFVTHMLVDPVIVELEKGANRAGWYLIMRYTIGTIGVIFSTVFAMYATLPRRRYEWEEVVREAGLAYLSCSVMFGGGVALARVWRGLKRTGKGQVSRLHG
jgi:uncharacterized membrane protein YidH (DUF202 family)